MNRALALSLFLLSIVVFAPTARSAEPPAYDTIVVCPAPLQAAMRPWFTHRMDQGRKIGVLSECDSPEAIRTAIRSAAEAGKLTHVLIVGDDHPDRKGNDALRSITVPAAKVKAKINVRFGSEAEIATDNWYADLDDDRVPDVAIGRLTGDSPEDVSAMVKKIIAYETSPDFTPWRRRVNFIAGVGGFGMVTDSILDMATKRFITTEIPAGYRTTMTHASLVSPFCPDPRRLPETCIARHNDGCLFWVYIGHGQRRYLDSMRVDGHAYPILDIDHVAAMRSAAGSPIAVFLACYTGAFDERDDCLSEAMLAAPHGPVAVIAGTRVTMPYANAVLAHAMLENAFAKDNATLGELLLNAKCEAASGAGGGANRELIDALATAISPNKEELDDERLEHLDLYNLLGDPLLKLHRPKPVEIAIEDTATSGELINVKGTTSINGRATVELVCRRDKLTFNAASRRGFRLTNDTVEQLTDDYARANDQRWATQQVNVVDGKLQTTIDIPADCHGHCHVRVYVEGQREFAIGAADLYVQRPRQATAT